MRFNLLLLLFISLVACRPKDQIQKEAVVDSIQPINDSLNASTTKAKIPSFNRVDESIDKLSAIGIGKMTEWKGAATEFTSFTPPFALGEKKMNNVAFVIESADRNYITSFKVILNIGDPKESRQALAKLKEIITKAFEALGIQLPTPLPNAILNTKEVIVDGVDYGTSFKSDSTKVPTWTLRVTTRTTP
ncbi:MAG: hypothetical protein ABIS36_14915 [Chryseolinea sp.]